MSRYDVLAKRTVSSATTVSGDVRAGNSYGSRRGNPAYRQFSAYIPLELYRSLKVRLAEADLELSEAVEQALAAWLKRESIGGP